MVVYVKYLILIAGLAGAVAGIKDSELAPAIIAAGAFISYALIEVRDLKTLNDTED